MLTGLFFCVFVPPAHEKTIPQREAAHPPDVSISKTALYSRIGTSEVEKPAGLLFQQPDLDSALQVARAEVQWHRVEKGHSGGPGKDLVSASCELDTHPGSLCAWSTPGKDARRPVGFDLP